MKSSSDCPKGEKDAEQIWEKLDTSSLPAAAWCEALLCLAHYSHGLRVCMVASADSHRALRLPLYSSRLGSGLLAGALAYVVSARPFPLPSMESLLLAWCFFE